jgi:hypothetical protein
MNDSVTVGGVVLRRRDKMDLQYNEEENSIHRGWRKMPEKLKYYDGEMSDRFVKMGYGISYMSRGGTSFRRPLYGIAVEGRDYVVYAGVEIVDDPPLEYFIECGFSDTEAEIAREVFISRRDSGKIVRSRWLKQRLRKRGMLGAMVTP